MDNRTDWVDYAKGIGIILVVYGHLLSSGYHAGLRIPDHFFKLSDSIIYGFHMPLFFLLSGFFVESNFQRYGSKDFLVDKLRCLAYPYFVWSTLQMTVEVIFSNYTQKGTSLSNIFAIVYQPWGQFWFIYALFFMHLIFVIANKVSKFATLSIFIIAGFIFFFPIQIEIAAINAFSAHFIFFVGGVLYREYLWEKEILKPGVWKSIVLFALLIGSGWFIFERLIKPTRLANGNQPEYFLFLAVIGILFCINLAKYLAQKNIFPFLKTLGLHSMQIYLAHMLVGVGIRVVLINVFHLESWILHIVLGVLFALIAPIYLKTISNRLSFPYIFEIPKKSTEPSHLG